MTAIPVWARFSTLAREIGKVRSSTYVSDYIHRQNLSSASVNLRGWLLFVSMRPDGHTLSIQF